MLWFVSGKSFSPPFPCGSLRCEQTRAAPTMMELRFKANSMSPVLVVARGLCRVLGGDNLTLALGLQGGPVHVSPFCSGRPCDCLGPRSLQVQSGTSDDTSAQLPLGFTC